MSKRKGFTLVELLVVIAIMAVLLTLITPALQKARQQAKLTLCMNNQHTLVVGLLYYTSDNEGKFPPSVLHRGGGLHTWANHINYHADRPMNAPNHGGAVYPFLGEYIEKVDVFACPLSASLPDYYQDLYARFDDPETWNLYNGGSSDMTTSVSYNMYWGGYKFSGTPPNNFEGPKKLSSKYGLLVCDLMNNWRSQFWQFAHPTKASFPGEATNPNTGTHMPVLWWSYESVYEPPLDLRMNAGYKDGRVERYISADSLSVYAGSATYFYLPSEWK